MVKFKDFDGVYKIEMYFSCPYVCKIEYRKCKRTKYGYEMIPTRDPERLTRVCHLPYIFGVGTIG